MQGDVIIVDQLHYEVAENLCVLMEQKNLFKKTFVSFSIAGESGSGKSEMAKALSDKLAEKHLKSIILAQDDYFNLPPKSNDLQRRKNPSWLGPEKEVKLKVMDDNIFTIKKGSTHIIKPLIDYKSNLVLEEKVNVFDVRVIIAEGTYTTLLKNVDLKIFIDRNKFDTHEHRKKRNRGNEFNDPFIEGILEKEHLIISPHKSMADILITKDYKVIDLNKI